MTKEELLEVIQFKNLDDRNKIKEHFTSPNDLDLDCDRFFDYYNDNCM